MGNPVAAEKLTTLYTRQLMKLRDYALAFGHDVDMTFNKSNDPECYVSIEQIKAELATREHVPNKQEAKIIRQRKAQESKNR